MWGVKGKVLVLVVVFVGFGAVCALAGGGKGAAKRPTAKDLLDKYAETQNKLKSFIIKFNNICNSISSKPGMPKHKRKIYKTNEVRFDGNRYKILQYISGDVFSTHISRDDPAYRNWLWDGKTIFVYTRSSKEYYEKTGKNSLGSISIYQKMRDSLKPRRMINSSADAYLCGFFNSDIERVDSILRQGNIVKVRDKMIEVSGSECYVIDGFTKHGKYTVWIDPQHGYNIAKATVHKKETDLYIGKPMAKGSKVQSYLENVRFEKIDNVWLPIEANIKCITNYSGRDNRYSGLGSSKYKYHHKRINVIINPDHDALVSFAPNFPNGAKVRFEPQKPKGHTWQDGKVVDEDGKEVDLDKLKKRKRK